MFVFNLPTFENKKYTVYDCFHGNGPYGEIPTKKEPIRALGFTLPISDDCFTILAIYKTMYDNYHNASKIALSDTCTL